MSFTKKVPSPMNAHAKMASPALFAVDFMAGFTWL